MIQPKLKPLTNKQIDVYALQGRYGAERRQEYLKSIRAGSANLRYLHPRIRKGEFGSDAQTALATAKKRRTFKRKANNARPKAPGCRTINVDQMAELKRLGIL